MKYCFGVDIGGTTVKLGLFSEAGAIVEKWEIVTRTENEGAAILPDVAEAINGKLEQHSIEKEQVLGIGVGVCAGSCYCRWNCQRFCESWLEI